MIGSMSQVVVPRVFPSDLYIGGRRCRRSDAGASSVGRARAGCGGGAGAGGSAWGDRGGLPGMVVGCLVFLQICWSVCDLWFDACFCTTFINILQLFVRFCWFFPSFQPGGDPRLEEQAGAQWEARQRLVLWPSGWSLGGGLTGWLVFSFCRWLPPVNPCDRW